MRSSEGRARLNILTESRVSNSLLVPDREMWERIRYRTGDLAFEDVPVIILDGYARSRGIGAVHLIKIDVQSYELKVLEGTTQTLKTTDYVFVEFAIRPLVHRGERFPPRAGLRSPCAPGTAATASCLKRTCCFGAATWRRWSGTPTKGIGSIAR